MELYLSRQIYTDESTIGKLFVDRVFECMTLEDVRRPDGEKVYGATCIPPGRYQIKLRYSQKFAHWMPWLQAVPGFEYVYFHAGNDAQSTEGCLLTGSYNPSAPDHLYKSKIAFDALYPKIEQAVKSGECWITIEDSGKWLRM